MESRERGTESAIYCSRMVKNENAPAVISQKRTCGRQLASVKCQLCHNVTEPWKYRPQISLLQFIINLFKGSKWLRGLSLGVK